MRQRSLEPNTYRYHRGGALVSAIVFGAIAAFCLAAIGQISLSHFSRVRVEKDYLAALYLAEAGVNYEMRKITEDPSKADTNSVASPLGASYNIGAGKFSVYCANANGSVPWSKSGDALIIATGVSNGVKRQVKMLAVAASSGGGKYAIYGVGNDKSNKITGNVTILDGDVGTNGDLEITPGANIGGTVYLNGPDAYMDLKKSPSYKVVYGKKAETFKTTDAIAKEMFPLGGLTWLASNNDNALSSPKLTSLSVKLKGKSTLTLKGKAGGANYYLSEIVCEGTSEIIFDNTAGPINIWMGPAKSCGNFQFRGGTSSVKMSADPSKRVTIYSALGSDMVFSGNSRLDAGIYYYMDTCGKVQFEGTPDLYGSVIAAEFELNGTPTIHYQDGYFGGGGATQYKRSASWLDAYRINE